VRIVKELMEIWLNEVCDITSEEREQSDLMHNIAHCDVLGHSHSMAANPRAR